MDLGCLCWSSQENCLWTPRQGVHLEASRPRRALCWPEEIRALERDHWKARDFGFKVELLEVARSTAAFQDALGENADRSPDRYVLSAFSLLKLEARGLALGLGSDTWSQKEGVLYVER